mgnify:CR=1 FL=1
MYEVLNEFFNKENGSLESNLKIWNNNKDKVTQYIAEYLNDKYFTGYVYNPAFGSTIKVTGSIVDGTIHLNVFACYVKIIVNTNLMNHESSES